VALLTNLPSFALYFVLALALFGAFIALYLHLTPYPELKLIREGNLSAALALLGSMFGFALPLASAIAHSVSLLDMVVWGVVALVVQALVYLLVSRLLPELRDGIHADQTAHGLFLGGSALCVGLINAACMVY
jgi:putative membrane protein